MKKAAFLLLLACCFALYFPLVGEVWEVRDQARINRPGYIIPSKFSRVLAFGNKGLLSDFLFLKVLTYYGEHVMKGQAMNETDWQFLVDGIDVVTDLDPFFLDPYVFAQGALAWEKGKTMQAIRLLKKGIAHRKQDWRLPFYVGFDYFYFLGDYAKGAEYLMLSSSRPGSPRFLSSLAARLGYYADKSQTAILFLKGMIAETQDPFLRANLELRLTALERAARLEALVETYEKRQGRPPGELHELVAAGYIDALPEDPYGGEWIILENGRVFSTSKFAFKKSREK